MIKIEIKNRFTGKILFEYSKDNNTIKDTVLKAIEDKADLRWANLSEANLSKANLSEADLSKADLRWANLSEADLRWANLSEANLRWANLSVIKADFFYVLLYGKNEIEFLKKNLIDGNIDGSTYEGECCCLSGTLKNGAIINNGIEQDINVGKIMACRKAERPAERWFLAIRKGDTPDKSQAAKITLEWIEEFEMLLK